MELNLPKFEFDTSKEPEKVEDPLPPEPQEAAQVERPEPEPEITLPEREPPRKGSLEYKLGKKLMVPAVMWFALDPTCGGAFVKQVPDLAYSLVQVAENNKSVKRFLEAFVQTSAWGEVVAASFPVLVAIVQHHNLLPSDMGKYLSVVTGQKLATVTPIREVDQPVTPENFDPTTYTGPGGNNEPPHADIPQVDTPTDPAHYTGPS